VTKAKIELPRSKITFVEFWNLPAMRRLIYLLAILLALTAVPSASASEAIQNDCWVNDVFATDMSWDSGVKVGPEQTSLMVSLEYIF
jgi:hypothetical protein